MLNRRFQNVWLCRNNEIGISFQYDWTVDVSRRHTLIIQIETRLDRVLYSIRIKNLRRSVRLFIASLRNIARGFCIIVARVVYYFVCLYFYFVVSSADLLGCERSTEKSRTRTWLEFTNPSPSQRSLDRIVRAGNDNNNNDDAVDRQRSTANVVDPRFVIDVTGPRQRWRAGKTKIWNPYHLRPGSFEFRSLCF